MKQVGKWENSFAWILYQNGLFIVLPKINQNNHNIQIFSAKCTQCKTFGKLFFVLTRVEISALSNCFCLRFQEYSILKRILFNNNKGYHLEIIFFNFIAFLAISDNYKHFLKIPIFGPKKGAHYGNLGWKSPFWGF